MASQIRVSEIGATTGIGSISFGTDDYVSTVGYTTFASKDVELNDGFYTNAQGLNTSRTLRSDKNGGIFGPFTINTGHTLTIETGATFTVL